MTDQLNEGDEHEQAEQGVLRENDGRMESGRGNPRLEVRPRGSSKGHAELGRIERFGHPQRGARRATTGLTDRSRAFLDLDGELGGSSDRDSGGNRGAEGLGGTSGSSVPELTWEQVMTLRALIVCIQPSCCCSPAPDYEALRPR
jgi:hypothetical protein